VPSWYRGGRVAIVWPVPPRKVGRYTPPETSGRYTRPVPKTVRRSPRWYGPLILFMLLFGILMILLNYMTVLPGAVTAWYLVAGLVIIFSAFVMATRYH
jgi:fatty acid desaturase